MKQFAMLGVAATLVLGGCATTNPNGSPSPSQSPAEVIAQVQKYAVAACGYAPAADFVGQLLNQFAPGAGLVTSMVKEICKAVTTRSARRGGGPPMVRGIVVRGQRVR